MEVQEKRTGWNLEQRGSLPTKTGAHPPSGDVTFPKSEALWL